MSTAVALRGRHVSVPRPSVRLGTILKIATAIVVLVALINVTSPRALGVLVALVVLTPWIIAVPVRGLQVLLAGAITIEIFPLGFPDSLTDRIPLFENLNNTLGLKGFSATPAELLMVLIVVAAFARSDSVVRARLFKGRLFGPYVVFMLAVLMGEAHGLFNGGDLNKSLWELRPQVYGFIGFVAASLLIRSRDDIERLAVIAAVAITFKGVIGDFRYFIVLNHSLGTHETVLGHEDSYFLALVPVAALVALIWTGRSRTFYYLAIASVVALAALLANERRAGIAALGAGIAIVVVFAIRFNALQRRRVLVLALIAAVACVVFLAVFWNTQHGLIGQLVRPVRSQFDPSYRDYLSDIYRQAENTNLKLSFQTNKILGMGFGMPFLIILTQADISNIYPLWNYIPHNTLLWVGVRMGLIGCATFWGLFGISLLEVCRSLSVQKDRFLLAIVALAGAAIVAELVVAYTDLQLESYRNMIFVGAVFGLVNVIPRLFPEPPEKRRTLA
ncbi:MAG TPA: O-antigen ligase family protein [Candidatus Dormibacteraeota bacterium]|nr:O-antigen ligase family protein [Candidatus Dormibacteraeota bacterium]